MNSDCRGTHPPQVGGVRSRIAMLALVALPVAFPLRVHAQEAVRAHLMGDPVPGQDAPAFSLLYATAEGPGPRDQPFVLRAELGRIVVLAFAAGVNDSSALRLFRSLADQYDELFPGDVVVAGVLPQSVPQLATWAGAHGVKGKVLADTGQQVRRMFGVDRGTIAVYVVGIDGRIAWRELRFTPSSASSYARLRDAVRKAARG